MDTSVIKTEISEMTSSISVVGVRSFVPLWMRISFGCSGSLLISSCRIVRA